MPSQAKYSGGSGTADDPYQIATADDLIALGETPEDYDKHFILTAEIDLDPNLPGRKVFNKAVIAPDMNDVASGFQGTPFSGCFDGQRHVIHNLLIHGNHYLGLFGQAADGSVIANIGLEAVDISGIGYYVGGLLGSSFGSISESYSIGNVSGYDIVGGLAGRNSGCIFDCNSTSAVKGGKYVGGLVGRNYESISNCFSMATVLGEINYVGGLVGYNSGGLSNCFSISTVYGEINVFVGGLVGYNEIGSISNCYSAGAVTGDWRVGGLVGGNLNFGSISNCYSTCAVTGDWYVGGLVGTNSNWSSGCISNCYSTGKVTGDRNVGGLMGSDDNWDLDSISNCFWDTQTSGLTHSEGGTGLSTEQMHYINTFLNAGWDCVDEDRNGTCDYWQVSDGNYPQLSYFVGSGPVMPEGLGTDQQPYLIRDVSDLGSIYIEPKAHYRLDSSLDLSDTTWSIAVIPNFDGTFDGNGHIISNLSIKGGVYLGLFGHLSSEALVYNLGLEIVGINGTGDLVGGLVGNNNGSVSNCYSIGVVTGNSDVGGIVGLNLGSVSNCYNTGSVTGNSDVGGMVGSNVGTVSNCYSTGSVTGGFNLGGLVGKNNGSISNSFWDIQTSGQINSDGGAGKTTAEMQAAATFLDAGWDFEDETENGTEDIWWIDEGQDYPRLWWEAID